jgi:hypothetical protein
MLVWLKSKFRCGRAISQKNQPSPFSLGFEDDATEPVEDSVSDVESFVYPIGTETPPGTSLVSFVDDEGFEWAINDGPPRRPSSIPRETPFIPLKIRPKKGYLKNNIFTETEVPDPSPIALQVIAMLPMSSAQEQLLRNFRATAIDINYHNGAHIRSHSRRKLKRNLPGRPRSSTESTVSSGNRRKSPNVVTHMPSDVRGIIAIKSALRRR